MSVTFLPSLASFSASETPMKYPSLSRMTTRSPGTSLPSSMICSGVSCHGRLESAPGIVSWVQPLRPSVAQ